MGKECKRKIGCRGLYRVCEVIFLMNFVMKSCENWGDGGVVFYNGGKRIFFSSMLGSFVYWLFIVRKFLI